MLLVQGTINEKTVYWCPDYVLKIVSRHFAPNLTSKLMSSYHKIIMWQNGLAQCLSNDITMSLWQYYRIHED
jgi:hypothetical protein